MKRFVMWLWVNNITTGWGGVPNGTLSMLLTCCPNLMFLAFPWYRDFKLVILLLWEVQSWYSFCYLWASPNCPYLFLFTDCGQVIVTLLSLGKTCREKQSKPSPFDKNSRTTQKIWHKLFPMIQSAGIKN